MHELFAQSEADKSEAQATLLIEQTNRVERQAVLLLRALRSIYVAIGAFAGATLVTLLGAGLASFQGMVWLRVLMTQGLVLGFVGVSVILGSANLFHATQISLMNITDEAAIIRQRHTLWKARPELEKVE